LKQVTIADVNGWAFGVRVSSRSSSRANRTLKGRDTDAEFGWPEMGSVGMLPPGNWCCLPGRRRRSLGCQDVVPNANDVVDSHLARDYPLNGGLCPGSGSAALTKPVITKLGFTSELHLSCKCCVWGPLCVCVTTVALSSKV